MFEVLLVLLGAILFLCLGAVLPIYLLWQKTRECHHLLNVILKREKAPTLLTPFEQLVTPEPKDKGEYKDRRSRPTQIDIAMKQAEERDTSEFLHDKGITTEH